MNDGNRDELLAFSSMLLADLTKAHGLQMMLASIPLVVTTCACSDPVTDVGVLTVFVVVVVFDLSFLMPPTQTGLFGHSSRRCLEDKLLNTIQEHSKALVLVALAVTTFSIGDILAPQISNQHCLLGNRI
jgi:hypothetical protein